MMEGEVLMRGKLLIRLLISFQVAVLGAAAAAGPLEAPATGNFRNRDASRLQELSFSLNRLPENPKQYSLVISDADERSISGSFSVDQLQILRAIMLEAEKFALTGEAVGTKEPITTRFMDKHEPAFVVDVQKNSSQSLLFFTLKTEIGRSTWEAGRTTRGTRREEGLFFELLTRLESVLPKPTQPAK